MNCWRKYSGWTRNKKNQIKLKYQKIKEDVKYYRDMYEIATKGPEIVFVFKFITILCCLLTMVGTALIASLIIYMSGICKCEIEEQKYAESLIRIDYVPVSIFYLKINI